MQPPPPEARDIDAAVAARFSNDLDQLAGVRPVALRYEDEEYQVGQG
jgi:hypothetical protein